MVHLAERPRSPRERRSYVRAPQPIEFPSEETVPETKRHLEARTTLYLLLRDAFPSAAVGSEQFVYWDAGDPKRCLAPDAFVKLGAREHVFETWKTWERGAPDLAVEIVSSSDRRDADWTDKLARYQASGVPEVVRFDPEDERVPLRVWDRVEGELLERAPESADLRECGALDLFWVITPSPYGPLLRLARDRDGQSLLTTPDEERVRLAGELAEERKARSQAEHERALAEHERSEAQRAREVAEQQRSSAEARLREEAEAREQERAATQAEIERLRAELAKARGEAR